MNGLALTSTESFFSHFIMTERHCRHVGWIEKAKLSLIHPLHFSFAQDHMAVISSGMSSCGFLREMYINNPLSLLDY
jgi:hypothetical protein